MRSFFLFFVQAPWQSACIYSPGLEDCQFAGMLLFVQICVCKYRDRFRGETRYKKRGFIVELEDVCVHTMHMHVRACKVIAYVCTRVIYAITLCIIIIIIVVCYYSFPFLFTFV